MKSPVPFKYFFIFWFLYPGSQGFWAKRTIAQIFSDDLIDVTVQSNLF